MKFKILVLCLFIGAGVFGSRESNNNRIRSPTCGKPHFQRQGHHLGGPRVAQGNFPW